VPPCRRGGAAGPAEQPADAASQPGSDRGGGAGPPAGGAVAAPNGGKALTARQQARRERVKAKRRKQKGRGRVASTCGGAALDSDGSEDELAKRLLKDRHKPKFGEQAMAPLQVHAACQEQGTVC